MPCLLLKWSDSTSKIRVCSKCMTRVLKGNFSITVSFHKWLNTDLWVIACNFSLFSGCLLTPSRPRLLLPVSYAGIRAQKACFVLGLERHSPLSSLEKPVWGNTITGRMSRSRGVTEPSAVLGGNSCHVSFGRRNWQCLLPGERSLLLAAEQ